MSFAARALGADQSPALIEAGGGVITYGELYRRSRRVAAMLHDAGLWRGDGVALVLFLAVILVKPDGLLGTPQERKV